MLYDATFLSRLESGVRAALPLWGLAEESGLSLLAVSENATFLAADGARRIVIRVYRPNYHTRAEILSELAWIAALRAAGTVATPAPVQSGTGEPLVAVHAGSTLRHAVAFEHAGGRAPDAEADRPRRFRRLGNVTARLHAQSCAWARPAGFQRRIWTFDTIVGSEAVWGDWRSARGLTEPGRAVLERLCRRLAAETAALCRTPDRFGLIHCDLRAANLLVDGDRMTVIDFDDCGLSWFGYDFAAAVSFVEDDPIVPSLMAAWLSGYREVRPFDAEQAGALATFVMLRRMQLTAWIASHAETPTAEAMGPAYTDGTVALAERYLAAGGDPAGP